MSLFELAMQEVTIIVSFRQDSLGLTAAGTAGAAAVCKVRALRFLLVSSSVRSKQLLRFMSGQGHKSEQKPYNRRTNLSDFITILIY